MGTRASRPHKQWHSRGYLPHCDHPGLVQSITFRLDDSVPANVIERWRAELNLAGGESAADPRCAEMRERIEKYADAGKGQCWLRNPEIAELVQNALLHFDGERYRLLAWCVMPNHVHALIEVVEGFPLGDVVHSWKSFTAKECNRALHRTGAFWMPDYHDRFIRDNNHLRKAVAYIQENPVKAGLCEISERWPWSSAGRKDAGEAPTLEDAGEAPTLKDAGETPTLEDAGETPAIPGGGQTHPLAKRAALYTLGCRLNQAETRLLEDQLLAAGYEVVPFGAPADVGIVHTCVVTREAESKSRQIIRRFIRANPGAAAVVIGCYAQTAGDRLAAMEGVRLVLGNHDKMHLAERLAALDPVETAVERQRPPSGVFVVPFLKDGPPITRRVNLKIQDGCDCMCRYCYIPFARGRSRSRRYEDALAEAASLTARGAQELVLTGVNIGDYRDGDRDLTALTDGLNALAPRPRVRISSIELSNIPEGLLERMADPEHGLAPHLHMPLQSGSDAVLQAMGRPYAAADYLAYLMRAAATVPGIGLGADVMVGFPGETDADFEATRSLISESPLSYLHVFQYSERPEVASARLPNKTPRDVMHARSRVLHRLDQDKRRTFQTKHIGASLEVLFESCRDGLWRGHTGNYLEIGVRDGCNLENSLVQVRIESLHDDLLLGRLEKTPGE